MANLGIDFDPNEVEPSAPREILPADKYPSQIVKSDVKDNSHETGKVLTLEFDVIDGPYKDRKFWVQLNIIHKTSVQAQEIAQRELSAICHAAGMQSNRVSDSEQLHFKPMLVNVGVNPPSVNKKTGKEYGPRNEAKGYEALPLGYKVPQSTGEAHNQQQSQSPAGSATKQRPWQR